VKSFQKGNIYRYTLSFYKNRRIKPGWKYCLILSNGFAANATTEGKVD